MDGKRFSNSFRNRHQLGFLSAGPPQSNLTFKAPDKSMPTDAALPLASGRPASSPILERFREMLREREDDLIRVSGYEAVATTPPTTDEIVPMYEEVLSELTFNSKPIITDLTIIAGDQREHGEGIADAICARIIEVPGELKLPAFYLLDSIVKNIGQEYIRHFSSRLPEVFIEAYKQVHPSMYRSMRHLFGTWSAVFPSPVLQIIESELQLSQAMSQQSSSMSDVRGSESPRPAHGIHINPKYLASVKSGIDNGKESSDLSVFGRKPAVAYDYDSDQGETTASFLESRKTNSSSYVGCPLLESDKLPPALSGGSSRIRDRENDSGDWRKRLLLDDKYHGLQNVTSYNESSGSKHDRTRALINAYGQDSGQRLNDDPSQRSLLKDNGISINNAARSWQNTEEEEFDWQDMNPSAWDRRSNGCFQSPGDFRARPGATNHGLSSFAANLKRKKWPGKTQVSLAGERFAEDTVPTMDAGHSLVPKYPLAKNDTIQPCDVIRPGTLVGRSGPTAYPLSERSSSSAGASPQSYMDHPFETDVHVGSFSNLDSRSGRLGYETSTAGAPPIQPLSLGSRAPLIQLSSQAQPFIPSHVQLNHILSGNDFTNMNNRAVNQGFQMFNNNGSASTLPLKPPNLPTPHPGMISSHHHTRPSLHHFPTLRESHQALNSSNLTTLHQQMASQPLSHGYSATSNTAMAPLPGMPSLQPHHISSLSFSAQGAIPSNSLGMSSGPTQIRPFSLSSGPNSNQPTGAYSGLFNSLMAQGLISMSNQPTVLDSVGVEFDQDLLKVRHEAAVRALYADLPRQCTTCGLRFKTQEEHSKHMDWHVTKNRIARNRKQNLSRKWFVSTTMWLSGAEALGSESAPGFLPAEAVEEKQEEEELAVPADVDQKTCALCGEPFEEFYSDELDEWMYRGAVYLNKSNGSTNVGMDSSQHGPIVHAKCRSESSSLPPEDFGPGEERCDGPQSKRMRL